MSLLEIEYVENTARITYQWPGFRAAGLILKTNGSEIKSVCCPCYDRSSKILYIQGTDIGSNFDRFSIRTENTLRIAQMVGALNEYNVCTTPEGIEFVKTGQGCFITMRCRELNDDTRELMHLYKGQYFRREARMNFRTTEDALEHLLIRLAGTGCAVGGTLISTRFFESKKVDL